MRHGKYNARKTPTSDGRVADSALEARRWEQLLLLQRGGVITDLRWKPRYPLPDGTTYVPDSDYKEKGVLVIEEVKGYETREWRRKHKLFRKVYPELNLVVLKKDDI